MEEDKKVVPPFIQIATAVAEAFGKGDDMASVDQLYGLDATGRVWRWEFGDPDWEGSQDGWELMPATLYREGKEPSEKKKGR